jgi:hypothetical protein
MRRVAVAALVALVSLAVRPGISEAAKPAWRLVATPAASASGAQLLSVSCSSAASCMAVGSVADLSGNRHALAESWDGSAWTIQPTPEPQGSIGSELEGVSCPLVRACIAVGFAQGSSSSSTLAEAWNGTVWTVLPTPNPSSLGNSLGSVSCVSTTACVAVGDYQSSPYATFSTLAESWDGHTWTLESPQNAEARASDLIGVSCMSSSVCTAVGWAGSQYGSSTLAELRVGPTWTTESSPSPPYSQLYSVACPATTSCIAVGPDLIESWSNAMWSVQPTPISGKFWGVSCSGTSSCTTVGSASPSGDATLAEVWDGSSWSVQPTPNPPGTNRQLLSVSCPSDRNCMAVGSYFDAAGVVQTLAELRS